MLSKQIILLLLMFILIFGVESCAKPRNATEPSNREHTVVTTVKSDDEVSESGTNVDDVPESYKGIGYPAPIEVEAPEDMWADYAYWGDRGNIPILPFSKIPPINERVTIIYEKDSLPKERLTRYVQFPGGKDALKRWIKSNMIYPAEAKGAKGVMLCMHVSKEGFVDSLFVSRASGDSHNPTVFTQTEEAALSLISNLPKLDPASDINGKPTESWHFVPLFYTTAEFEEEVERNAKKLLEDDVLIDYALPAPEYPGGEDKMREWIQQQLSDKDIPFIGRVTLELKVISQGYITFIKSVKHRDVEAETEAFRIVGEMPRWRPSFLPRTGLLDFTYILPITFWPKN